MKRSWNQIIESKNKAEEIPRLTARESPRVPPAVSQGAASTDGRTAISRMVVSKENVELTDYSTRKLLKSNGMVLEELTIGTRKTKQ